MATNHIYVILVVTKSFAYDIAFDILLIFYDFTLESGPDRKGISRCTRDRPARVVPPTSLLH